MRFMVVFVLLLPSVATAGPCLQTSIQELLKDYSDRDEFFRRIQSVNPLIQNESEVRILLTEEFFARIPRSSVGLKFKRDLIWRLARLDLPMNLSKEEMKLLANRPSNFVFSRIQSIRFKIPGGNSIAA